MLLEFLEFLEFLERVHKGTSQSLHSKMLKTKSTLGNPLVNRCYIASAQTNGGICLAVVIGQWNP